MERPPASGNIEFEIPFGPVSLQAESRRKAAARENFRRSLPNTKFLLSGDVKIDIEWLVHERARYESDVAPDIDNILKPLMDVLCGPDGILIDDNQVQSLTCSWIDWTTDNQHLRLHIGFDPDAFVSKDGLTFVEFEKCLCMPMNKNASSESLRLLTKTLKAQFDARNTLQRQGLNYYEAKNVMSIQRVFHKSRVCRFEVISYQSLLS